MGVITGDSYEMPEWRRCGVANPGGEPCGKDRGHPGPHDVEAYGPPCPGQCESEAQERLERTRRSLEVKRR